MFYALTVVTLLATILFYSFYPRNDGIKTVDMPRNKAIVMQMVSQHAAAVEAARIVSYDELAHKNRMAYEKWVSDEIMVGYTIPDSLYSQFLPAGYQKGPVRTNLYCIDNSTGYVVSQCAIRTADPTRPELQQGTTDLIISYMEADDPLQSRALGEVVHLTSYTDDEHLKINCGVAVCDSEGCVIDNTRYQTVTLPASLQGLDGYLVCVTQLSVAYDGRNMIQMP